MNIIEAPLKGFRRFRSETDRIRELRAQKEALALVQRMVSILLSYIILLLYNYRVQRNTKYTK